MRKSRKQGKHQPIGKTKKDIMLIILDANASIKTSKIKTKLKEKSNVTEDKLIGKHLKKLRKERLIQMSNITRGYQAEWSINKDLKTIDKIATYLSDRRRELLKTELTQEIITEEFLKYYLRKYFDTVLKEINNSTRSITKTIIPLPREVFKSRILGKAFKKMLKEQDILNLLIPENKMNDILNMIKSSPSAFTFILEIDKNKHLWNGIYSTFIKKTKPVLDVVMGQMKNAMNNIQLSEEELTKKIDKAMEETKEEYTKETFLSKLIESLFITDILTEKAINNEYVNQFTLKELYLYTKNENIITEWTRNFHQS